MSIQITIDTNGDAFEADYSGELALVLDRIKAKLADLAPSDSGLRAARDTNGNTVARIEIESDDYRSGWTPAPAKRFPGGLSTR
jgi:hypothetical protein